MNYIGSLEEIKTDFHIFAKNINGKIIIHYLKDVIIDFFKRTRCLIRGSRTLDNLLSNHHRKYHTIVIFKRVPD